MTEKCKKATDNAIINNRHRNLLKNVYHKASLQIDNEENMQTRKIKNKDANSKMPLVKTIYFALEDMQKTLN